MNTLKLNHRSHRPVCLAPRALGLVLLLLLPAAGAVAKTVWLDELDVSKTMQEWGNPQKNKSVEGHPLSIGGVRFQRGLGSHAESLLYIDLQAGSRRFTAKVGVDDEVGESSGAAVQFSIVGDGKVLWKSAVMKAAQPAQEADVSLAGVKSLLLKIAPAGEGIDFDHADWVEAAFEVDGQNPATIEAPRLQPPAILTPPAPDKPRLTGPAVFGVRPGHPVLFTISATGKEPMTYDADHLPQGLKVDPASGQITGTLAQAGDYTIALRAQNALGMATRDMRIKCGTQIALTPPMGWNSWNCFAGAVDDAKVRSAADAMVASGLIHHGWTYINIDDCWEGKRDAQGRIQPNKKFPDMKALADYVHSKGLKIGLYSSPGPTTCAGFAASWKHEQLDADQYAAWGFDYLKYDWCSYGQVQEMSLPEQERLMKPYQVMRQALDQENRDIVYSLCQYGMGQVWQWGPQVGGNCWRTTGDITDRWTSMANIGFRQAGHEKYASPGHWNDPDMLVVGKLGWGQLRPTRLTPDEQYTHISLWCLLAAPLLIGCDLSQLDDFTLALLSNDEVLALDQDALGRQARRVIQDGSLEAWSKAMEDGSIALGLFNRGDEPASLKVPWTALGLSGNHGVRDLWRQQDLGAFSDSFSASIPRHGVVLVRVLQ
jgi:alpha-galactosidase